MNAIIRQAKPGEEKSIHEVHMRSIREVCVKDHGEDEVRGWGNRPLGDRWKKAIENGEVLVIERHGEIAGVGYLSVEKGRAVLQSLYLAPEALGEGHGKALAQELIQKAKRKNAKEISLDSSITARDFYKKLGFVDAGAAQKHDIGGHPVTCYPMVLKL